MRRLDPARRAELIAPFVRRREADRLLAAASPQSTAATLSVSTPVAARLAGSVRLGARVGRLLRERRGLGGEPPPALARLLSDPAEAVAFANAVGLTLFLARCRAVLTKAEIEALMRIHGDRVVAFAFGRQARLPGAGRDRTLGALALHDKPRIQELGVSALLGWAADRHGGQAAWLSVLFPQGRPDAGEAEAVELLVREWWPA